MDKRKLVILGASLVAVVGLVLLLTLGSADDASGPARRSAAPPTGPTDAPPLFDPQAGTQQPNITTIATAENYYVQWLSKNGQLTELAGKTLQPLPAGEQLIGKFVGRVHLVDQRRVVQIQADEGQLYAPDGRPQNGKLHGDVTVTLFDAPADQPVDFSPTSPHVALRMYLDDDVRFDLLAGQLDSDGPVHVTGPQIDFRGRGLLVRYNELASRIERLEIAHGEQLRIKPQPPAARRSGVRPAPQAGGEQDRLGEPPQFYHLSFDRLQGVQSADIQIRGDTLDILFALGRDSGDSPLLDQFGSQPIDDSPLSPLPWPSDRRIGPALSLAALTLAQVSPPMDRTLAPPGPDDVVIDWSGPMVMQPADSLPQTITGPRDTLLRVSGRPVQVRTLEQDLVTAAEVSFLTTGGQIRLTGSQAYPLVIDSPRLGLLHGTELVIDTGLATGMMTGPGRMRVRRAEQIVTARQSGAPLQPDSQTTIQWSERLTISFYASDALDVDPADPNRLRAIQHVSVAGDAAAVSPDFDLRAGVLSVDLSDPEVGPQFVEQVAAVHDVRLTADDAPSDQPLQLQSEHLQIDLTSDGQGTASPSHLSADGDVHASSAEMILVAGQVEADLQPPSNAGAAIQPPPAVLSSAAAPPSPPPLPLDWDRLFAMQPDLSVTTDIFAAATSDDHSLADVAPLPMDEPTGTPSQTMAIGRLEARGDVQVELVERGVILAAGRLVVDQPLGRIDLYGTDAVPASVRRQQDVLTGEHIVMDRDSSTLDIPGPGLMSIHAKSTQDVPPPSQPPTHPITVAWQEAMHYDDPSSQVRFLGQTQVTRRAALEDVQLRSAELVLNLLRSSDDELAIRTATARDDVVFIAQRWADQPNRTIATRLHLTGPTLKFDGVLEQLQVVGAGTLLVEDYAAQDQSRSGAASPGDGGLEAVVALGGRGATLFTWAGEFLLDASHNDMRMTDRVQMSHLPQGSDQKVYLDCRQLLADLEETGGLSSLLSGTPVQPRIIAIYARDAVRVVDRRRTILADHLQYTAVDQQVMLRGEPNGLGSVMVNEDSGSTLTAEQVRWNLTRDEIEILKPGPTRAPITDLPSSPVRLEPTTSIQPPAATEPQPTKPKPKRHPRPRHKPRR